jgi:pyridoxine/pyridoxamine 5'-phosphate oxidase
MSPENIFEFVRSHRLAVVATISDDGKPEAALMGIAMMPDRRIIFDTLKNSRKYLNLRHTRAVALVVGWERETTVQLEGLAQQPTGVDLERCKDAYFAAYPDGRERQAWPDIAYLAVRITWMRYSDYSAGGRIVEHSL